MKTVSNKIVSVPTETILGSQSRSRTAHLNSITELLEAKKNDSENTLQTITQNNSHQTLNKGTTHNHSPSSQQLHKPAFTRMPVQVTAHNQPAATMLITCNQSSGRTLRRRRVS